MIATAPSTPIATMNVAPIGCLGIGVLALVELDTNAKPKEICRKIKGDTSSRRLGGDHGAQHQFRARAPHAHGNFLSNIGLGNSVS